MKCPKCNKDMKVIKSDTSNDPKNGKVYERTLHLCESCDIWINVEIPQEK